jgi:hypothetical protein
MTFAICFLLEFAEVYSTIPRMPSAVIAVSGHLSPRLTEPAEFLLTATCW